MRNVIRHLDTGLFYGKGGKWVDDPSQALAFVDEVRARDFCIYRHIARATVTALPEHDSPERVPAPSGAARPIAHEPEPEIGKMKLKAVRVAPTPNPTAKPVAAAKRGAAGSVADKPGSARRGESGIAKKTASQKAATRRPKTDKPLATKSVLTTVEVKIDVGFGNALFIRGQGDSLSWDQGVPLQCVDPSTWVWSTRRSKNQLVFKLLLNDQVWSQGDNFIAPLGQRTEVSPVF